MERIAKKITLLTLFSFIFLTLQAQIPNGYYDNATGKTGNELKAALHDIIKNHTTISYGDLWNAFWSTDNKGNGVVWDMYSDGANYTYYYTNGNDQCGSYDGEGDCYNREHSWPQSWFNDQTTPRTDLHHIYPTDGFVNNQRSNHPFGEVGSGATTFQNGSKLGNCKSSLGYSGTVFEPIDEYKGDFARAYFYMSTRYYTEDANWGSSGMTNRSVILPWAMTMLLRWNDADPVSQKEIDRNNVIYNDYQYNRNPFIDHPEYAHMIWDENWQGGTTYAITCATGLSHGTVSAPASAMEGTTVSINATPDPGYMVGSYSVYKTGSPNTTISVSSNGTFTMPDHAVTVSATFIENNTFYTIALGNVSHGSISASTYSAKSGTTIQLFANPDTGYSLYSWYVYKTGDMNTSVNVNDNSFIMPAFDVTVMATFIQGTVSNGDYVKVTSTPSDWSGVYLIVYEDGTVAFDGGLTILDVASNTIDVSISNNAIPSNATTDAASFTIAKSGSNYTIKSASGYYIGQTSNANGMQTNQSTSYANTLSYTSGNVNIVSGGAYLRYNDQSGQTRFRYYKSSSYTGQKAIQLYKKSTVTSTPTHTIHFNNNGGTGSMPDQTVNEFEPTALQENTFTRDGFVFDGWNTAQDGTGTYYADGATVSLLDDLTLYAQWNQLFHITLATVSHGTISANVTEAFKDTEIVLTATPDPLYALDHWVVTDAQNNAITVTDNLFEMPASDVTVSAVFSYSQQTFVQEYQLVTSTDQLVAGRTYLIVNVPNGKALGTTQNTNNRSAAAVTIEDDVIHEIGNTVCELTLGGSTGSWTFFDEGYGANGGYLCSASSNSNYLRTQTNNNANSQWSISIGTNGVATIKSQGSYTRNLLKYNNSNDIFACYASGNTMLDVYLFRRTEPSDYPMEWNVTLAQGWTWFSSPVEADNLLAQLKDQLGTSGLEITSKDDGNLTYYNGLGWLGTLSSIQGEKMYKIKTNSECAVSLTGAPANPENHPITIVKNGYTWIGFPFTENLNLTAALANFEPTNGDVIKSKSGQSATYVTGLGWLGGANMILQPGQGYIYQSKATTNKTLIFSSGQ